jgi:predicted O-methyltransferase YrrM
MDQGIPGSFVECGVWKGGSSAIMALAIKDAGQQRHLHLFDSFEGLPEPGENDGAEAAAYSGGRNQGKLATIDECCAELNEVRKLILEKINLPEALAHFYVGWFQDTVPAASTHLGPIALLRLDGDWYDSTKICLDHLYPLLSPGGIIILDDYFAWEGCRKATDEYRALHKINCPIQRLDMQAMFWVKE